jgi:phage gp16-like protein
MNRARLIKLIKTGQRFMGWPDDIYRDWLEKHTGRRSCTACTDAQLAHLVDALRTLGFAPPPAPRARGGSGPGHPTQDQWRKLEVLAKRLGFTGLDDPGLATFCHRQTKVDTPRFLDSRGISKFIYVLEKWLASKETQPQPGTPRRPRQKGKS